MIAASQNLMPPPFFLGRDICARLRVCYLQTLYLCRFCTSILIYLSVFIHNIYIYTQKNKDGEKNWGKKAPVGK